MNEKNDQNTPSDAKKAWQTPELREQTIHGSTAQGKYSNPSNESSPLAGKPS